MSPQEEKGPTVVFAVVPANLGPLVVTEARVNNTANRKGHGSCGRTLARSIE